jgi:GNAT superfamily N-acetyltransferase
VPVGFAPVEALAPDHDLAGFDSGSPELDHWLAAWARHSQRVDAVRTFVVCPVGDRRVMGYHSLVATTASREEAPRRLARAAGPHAVPLVLLARLAVSRECQGRGLDAELLRDAALRTLQAADHVGAVALMVHAKDGDARSFYEHFGFQPSPLQPLQLFLPLHTIRQAVFVANREDVVEGEAAG